MVSNKILTRLFGLFLLFSCLLSLHADVALSREIKSNNEKLEMELHEINQISTGDQMDMEEVNLNGRMDLGRDYPSWEPTVGITRETLADPDFTYVN